MFTFLERYLSRMSGKSMPVDLDAVKPFMGFCTAIIYIYINDHQWPNLWVQNFPISVALTPALHLLQQVQCQHPMISIGHGSHRRTETHLTSCAPPKKNWGIFPESVPHAGCFFFQTGMFFSKMYVFFSVNRHVFPQTASLNMFSLKSLLS